MAERHPLIAKEGSKGKSIHQIIACGTVILSIATVGTIMGFSAVTVPTLRLPDSDIHTSKSEASWVASSAPLCSMIGCLFSGLFGERLGRRGIILVGSFFCVVAWLLIGLAASLHTLLAGRLLGGFAMGMYDPQVQVYICEVAEPWLRGTMGTATGVTVMLGILFVYVLGSLFHWRTVAFFSIIFPAIVFVGMVFMPESPTWLMSRGKRDMAARALSWLRDSGDVSGELEKIAVNQERNAEYRLSWRLFAKRCLSPSVRRPFLLCVGMMFFQEFAGVYTVTFYQVNVFQEASSSINEYLATVIVGAVRVVLMMLTCYVMSVFGRRQLLVTSGLCMSLSTGLMGVYFYFKDVLPGWLPLVFFLAFTASFCLGFEPLPFIMMPELLPSDVRSLGTAIGSTSFELFMFLNVKSFHFFLDALQPYGTFWLYSAAALLGSLFVYTFVPETKGKSLEEIESYFRGETRSEHDETKADRRIDITRLVGNDKNPLSTQFALHVRESKYTSSIRVV